MGLLKDPEISCRKKITFEQVSQFRTYIKYKYRYKLYLDGIPSAVIVRNEETGIMEPDYK